MICHFEGIRLLILAWISGFNFFIENFEYISLTAGFRMSTLAQNVPQVVNYQKQVKFIDWDFPCQENNTFKNVALLDEANPVSG